MPNPFLRLFRRTPPATQTAAKATPEDALENAALAHLRDRRAELKAASQALAEGRPAEFLDRLPKLERLDVLNASGQSFAHEFLLEAAGRGYLEVVRALIARGVAANGTGLIRRGAGPGDTALHAAAGRGQMEVARLLLEQGAEVNAMNGWGETPLHCAVAQRQLAMVAYLLEHGAEIDARRAGSDVGTPLWRAAEHLFLDEVRYLLEHGADPRLINEAKHQTPSERAHRGFEEACGQFHRTRGEERAQIGARIKQYETLVGQLQTAERRLGPIE